MTRLTQKQLIKDIKGLKQIKPRAEWVSLLKSELLAEKKAEVLVQETKTVGIKDILFSFLFQKKLAYAFTAVLFLIGGIFGFANYTVPGDLLFPVKKVAEQSQAALTGKTALKKNVTTLNNRINELAQVAKEGKKESIPSAISEVNANASELVKTLAAQQDGNLETLKEISVSLRVLADVPGTDMTEIPEVKDLYATVVINQIKDLQKSTLTEEQDEILKETEELFEQEDYTEALEKILLINK